MWDALSQDVTGWAVAGVLIIIIALAIGSGRWVPLGLVRQMIQPHKEARDEAEKRADRWESAWYKLYAAQQIRSSSEQTAVSEVALTLATTIKKLRDAAEDGGDEHDVVHTTPVE